MKILIITDLEGISCVDNISMIFDDGYSRACEFLMDDVNIAVDAAYKAGADEVYVIDGHAGGNNFIKDKLDSRAVEVLSSEFVHDNLDIYDAMVLIGAHAKAGTVNAFLDHTQSSLEWFDFTVGGKSYGEIGQQAILAGAYGIPVVAVSGDEAACNEAKELFPGIACASVKNTTVRNSAICVEHKTALELIFNAVYDGIKRIKEIKPYTISLPTEKSLTFFRNDYCDKIMHEGLCRENRTVKKTITKIETLYDIISF